MPAAAKPRRSRKDRRFTTFASRARSTACWRGSTTAKISLTAQIEHQQHLGFLIFRTILCFVNFPSRNEYLKQAATFRDETAASPVNEALRVHRSGDAAEKRE